MIEKASGVANGIIKHIECRKEFVYKRNLDKD